MTRVRGRAAAVAAVLAAGLLLAACGGGGDGDDDKAYVEPQGPASETISIDAKNFSFTPDDIIAEPGIAKIELVGEGGVHDLVFDDGAYSGFRLDVSGSETDSKKIDLERGKFIFYCSLPGHRAAGMEGTLRVR